jgi:ribosomal protein L16/L10AE
MSLNDRQISDREIKALQIVAKTQLKRKGNVWIVPFTSGPR